MKKILFLFACLLSSLFGGEITIAVSANVSYAIKPLIKTFVKTHPETKVHVVLGSSGKLLAQIIHGAPYDLFMSANMKYPNRLYDQQMTVSKPVIYAKGALALFSSKLKVYDKGLDILADKTIVKIAIANPKIAPYGVATKEALENAELYSKLEKKFVYGESISQTVIYATTATDIGIIALSALYSPQMKAYKQNNHWTEVNKSLYTSIDQGMVILKSAQAQREVKAFYDFILSATAQKILKSFGYKIP